MRVLIIAVALTGLVAASAATAQSTPRSNVEMRGTVRPAPDMYTSYLRTRDSVFRAWKDDEKNRMMSNSYRTVLRFAECVAKFDRNAATRVLGSEITSSQSGSALTDMARANRGCAVEYRNVHPLLLRVALAETQIKYGAESASPAGQRSVGVPAKVGGYPLRLISDCQVRHSPELVRALLQTQPASQAERDAAEALFGRTGECGAPRLGRLAPTAARLAVIEAEYSRRFGQADGAAHR